MTSEDVLLAQAELDRAQVALDQIRSLPQGIGDEVRWSNGVIWRRVGWNHWLPLDGDQPDASGGVYRSTHVASGRIVHDEEADAS